jgi:hypothetical protein
MRSVDRPSDKAHGREQTNEHPNIWVRIDSSKYAENISINLNRDFECFWAIREVVMVELCSESDFLQNLTMTAFGVV